MKLRFDEVLYDLEQETTLTLIRKGPRFLGDLRYVLA
jgi:hypothetical protein